ncbi:DoxX family protein [Bradyrhizobium sp. INPA01-394B]|uniref:DoxX family protein n=1 Tax=Bradyrhizobium campsiandrae TaxID=1729892 RepID=A0ABR7U7V5_9BRAD|nr:DoxX family protein [Bradyrhizobium campsiandrae]MBC9882089.1 DoxX family protein [Bradyrhizobium campsiandrae]MBC9979650.1 DoxX family protein [Bradyrhizobium campsiandrae]
MIDSRTAPYAALVLRATLGALFLAHASLKLFVFTPAGTAKFFGSLGFPPELAYLVMTVEVLTGIALILGVWTRYAALAGIPVLLGAIFSVHAAAGFFFTNPKGGWEFPAFWAIALVAQALLGDGAFALRPSRDVEAANAQLSVAPSR